MITPRRWIAVVRRISARITSNATWITRTRPPIISIRHPSIHRRSTLQSKCLRCSPYWRPFTSHTEIVKAIMYTVSNSRQIWLTVTSTYVNFNAHLRMSTYRPRNFFYQILWSKAGTHAVQRFLHSAPTCPTQSLRYSPAIRRTKHRALCSNQIKSNMTLIMVDKPQPSYNLLNVMK